MPVTRRFEPLATGCGLALIGVALTLGACRQSAEPAAQAPSTAPAAPDTKPGVSLSDARLALPAVGGRPGALYFTLRNTGPVPATIGEIHVDGAARAEMHETSGGTMKPIVSLQVPAGATIAFTPGGKHVMAFRLAPSLVAGGNTRMTVSLADGEKLSAVVAVRAPGDGGTHAMTMDMH